MSEKIKNSDKNTEAEETEKDSAGNIIDDDAPDDAVTAETDDAAADSAADNTADDSETGNTAAENSETSEVKEADNIPSKTFKESVNDLTSLCISFISENNVVARLIGLFLLFSSGVFITNYNKENRQRFFELHNGDAWKDYCNSVSIGKMAAFIIIGFLLKISLIKE